MRPSIDGRRVVVVKEQGVAKHRRLKTSPPHQDAAYTVPCPDSRYCIDIIELRR
jgi:hypothetical protein